MKTCKHCGEEIQGDRAASDYCSARCERARACAKGYLERRSWSELQACGLVWWINRMLDLFGWAIVLEQTDGRVVDVYPARTRFRGFSQEIEDRGYERLSRYLQDVRGQLVEDCELEGENLKSRAPKSDSEKCIEALQATKDDPEESEEVSR